MKLNTSIENINITFSCEENWNKMDKVSSQSKHCHSCNKSVIDFTQFTENEIIQYFENRKNKNSCGRFGSLQLNQLNRKLATENKTSISRYVAPLLFGALLSSSACKTNEDIFPPSPPISHIYEPGYTIIERGFNADSLSTSKIKGVVIDQSGEALKGVFIYSPSNLSFGSVTDKEGYFEFEFPKKDYYDNLQIELIGFEYSSINIAEINNNEIRIVMKTAPIYNAVCTLGVVTIREPWHKRVWRKLFKRRR